MQRMAWFLFLFFFGTGSTLWARSEIVRVRLKANLSQVFLSGMNLRILGSQEKYRPVAIVKNKQLQISKVTVAGKAYWQVRQAPGVSPQDLLSAEGALLVQGENLRQEATDLPNLILLKESDSGQIDVIGLVPLEEYVLSVLASEMPLSWPVETLKAQAVAIRSYTLSMMQDRKNRTFHLEASVLDQVYRKLHSHQGSALLAKAQAAVDATEGVALYNSKGQILKAFYHSDCGGKTVSASSVWSRESDHNAGVAVDAGCPENPMAQWRYEVAKGKLSGLVKNLMGGLHSNEFRKRLGFMNLRSTNFEIRDRGDQIEFVGKGFGHGVGLCQWGSRRLGMKGMAYQRILKHYYPLATLK